MSRPCHVSPSKRGRVAGFVCPVPFPTRGRGRPPLPAPRTHLERDASTRGRRRRRGRARASREAGGGRRRGQRAGRGTGAGRGEGTERPPRTARGQPGPAPPRGLGCHGRVGVPRVGGESGRCPQGAWLTRVGTALLIGVLWCPGWVAPGCLAKPPVPRSALLFQAGVPGGAQRVRAGCPGMLSSPSQAFPVCSAHPTEWPQGAWLILLLGPSLLLGVALLHPQEAPGMLI